MLFDIVPISASCTCILHILARLYRLSYMTTGLVLDEGHACKECLGDHVIILARDCTSVSTSLRVSTRSSVSSLFLAVTDLSSGAMIALARYILLVRSCPSFSVDPTDVRTQWQLHWISSKQ